MELVDTASPPTGLFAPDVADYQHDGSRPSDGQVRALRSNTPLPTYEEAVGPSANVALYTDLMTERPTKLTMEAFVPGDYMVYSPNRTMLFRTHTLVIARGIKVTYLRRNSQPFILKCKTLGRQWQYYADDVTTGKGRLFEIDSHKKFFDGDVARMTFRNDVSQEKELLEIRPDRESMRWEVYHDARKIAHIIFPSNTEKYSIEIPVPGVDPSLLIALVLVINYGATELEGR